MNYMFWVWLAIIVGPIVVNALKKKRDTSASRPPSRRAAEPVRPEGTGPMTFEELLAEIQGKKTISKAPAQSVTGKVVDYDDEGTRRKKSKPLEDTQYDYRKEDKIYETYENAKKLAFTRPSLEETMKLEDTNMKFGAFGKYRTTQANSYTKGILARLRTPEGFKEAFIMNEIMQRKF